MQKDLKYKILGTVVLTVIAIVCCAILTVLYNSGIF